MFMFVTKTLLLLSVLGTAAAQCATDKRLVYENQNLDTDGTLSPHIAYDNYGYPYTGATGASSDNYRYADSFMDQCRFAAGTVYDNGVSSAHSGILFAQDTDSLTHTTSGNRKANYCTWVQSTAELIPAGVTQVSLKIRAAEYGSLDANDDVQGEVRFCSTAAATTCGSWEKILEKNDDISTSTSSTGLNRVSSLTKQDSTTSSLAMWQNHASLHWLSSDSNATNPNNYLYVQTRMRLYNTESDEMHLITAFEVCDATPAPVPVPCPANTFSESGTYVSPGSCTAHTVCTSSEYLVTPGTATSNADCAVHPCSDSTLNTCDNRERDAGELEASCGLNSDCPNTRGTCTRGVAAAYTCACRNPESDDHGMHYILTSTGQCSLVSGDVQVTIDIPDTLVTIVPGPSIVGFAPGAEAVLTQAIAATYAVDPGQVTVTLVPIYARRRLQQIVGYSVLVTVVAADTSGLDAIREESQASDFTEQVVTQLSNPTVVQLATQADPAVAQIASVVAQTSPEDFQVGHVEVALLDPTMTHSPTLAPTPAPTPSCPVTCELVPVLNQSISHTPDVTSPYNYAGAAANTHATVDDDSYKVKVTHDVNEVNIYSGGQYSQSYMHHRCFRIADTTDCTCECVGDEAYFAEEKYGRYQNATGVTTSNSDTRTNILNADTDYNPWNDDPNNVDVSDLDSLKGFWSSGNLDPADGTPRARVGA